MLRESKSTFKTARTIKFIHSTVDFRNILSIMVSCSPSLLYNAIFCFTGILGVLLIQYLDYQGIGNPASGLSTMTMFLGLLLLSVPIQICIKHNTPFDWRLVFFLLLNICGEATTQYSISKLGSGIYIVVYSSVLFCSIVS